MGSLSDDGPSMVHHSNGNSTEIVLENGQYASSLIQPKYKRRKISAIRDFPPGCGRNAPRLDQIPEASADRDSPPACRDNIPQIDQKALGTEAAALHDDKENLTADVKTVTIPADGSSSASENGNMHPSNEIVKSDQKEPGTEAATLHDDRENLIADVKIVTVPADGTSNSSENGNVHLSNEIVKNVDKLEVPGVLCNPVETVVPSFDMMDVVQVPYILEYHGDLQKIPDVKVHEPNGELQEVEVHTGAMGDSSLDLLENGSKENGCAGNPLAGVGARSPSPLPISNPNTSEENPKGKKYPRRRVSATRDFPPFCGRNALCPTEEERRQICGKKESGDSEKVVEGTLVTNTGRKTVEKLDGNAQDESLQMNELKGSLPEAKKTGVDAEASAAREKMQYGAVYSRGNGFTKKRKLKDSVPEPKTEAILITGKDKEGVGKEIVVYSPDNGFISDTPINDDSSECELEKVASPTPSDDDLSKRELGAVVVQGLIAAPNSPWGSGKGASKPESVPKKKAHGTAYSGRKAAKKTTQPLKNATYFSKQPLAVEDEAGVSVQGRYEDPPRPRNNVEVSLPPSLNISSDGGARNRVKEVVRLYQVICRKLLQQEEAKLKPQGPGKNRIDLHAMQIIKDKGKELNIGKVVGPVPGVEVGDEFQYRVELALVGIHRIYQGGIDYTKQGKDIIATSIVASGGYADELDSADVLVYSGQGGNVNEKKKEPEDQKLERGNLALKNSIEFRNPVRVIRGSKETAKSSKSDAKSKVVLTYTYDGLYTVDRYWHEMGPHGKLVFKFELKRIPGQPELAWKEVKKSNKFKVREGLCVDDISKGKERFRVCAINTVDNEGPPTFTYITEMKYPHWFRPTPQKGCDCVGGCSDSQKCSCAVKNGGEIPYNFNGAIVEAKPLVFECGPSCKCPPSCYNRVSQHGMKIQLEIFKTKSRGWGVRSLTSIPSGSFICEYFGELLEDKDAEVRENDEYLFDIGHNFSDLPSFEGLSTPKPEGQSNLNADVEEDTGFTIDAAKFGNVGRFINHSCSPNCYAQNVIYDHQDKRMPHIMFFAADNIPPLQELTYHYNYQVGQVRDSRGNVRVKSCHCGSSDCTGRMY